MDQNTNSNEEDTHPAHPPAPNTDIIVFDGVYDKKNNPENDTPFLEIEK